MNENPLNFMKLVLHVQFSPVDCCINMMVVEKDSSNNNSLSVLAHFGSEVPKVKLHFAQCTDFAWNPSIRKMTGLYIKPSIWVRSCVSQQTIIDNNNDVF